MSKAIYPSKYTNRKVTAAQYLTDEIMERIARQEKKVLTYRYWNDPQWKKIFIRQLGEANHILKKVDCISVMNYLRSVKGRNITSLGLKAQIINGCKLFAKTIVDCEQNIDNVIINDEFIEDIPAEEINIETNKAKPSLWERL